MIHCSTASLLTLGFRSVTLPAFTINNQVRAYRKEKLAPTLIIVCVGGATLATMLWMVGASVFRQWYFYPSLIFWIFSVICLVTAKARTWDRKVWKACQWWSGIWMIAFLLTFCAPPVSTMLVPVLFAPIAGSGGIHPFLAAFAHIMIWACVSDILKPSMPEEKAG